MSATGMTEVATGMNEVATGMTLLGPPGLFNIILGSTNNMDLSMVGSAAF